MTPIPRHKLGWLAALLLFTYSEAAPAADSKPTTETPEPKATTTKTIDRTVARTTSVPTPGSDIETAESVIVIRAPMSQVRRVLQRYQRYKQILPRIDQSRIVGKKKGHTDLYMRAPILHGLAHMWMVTRFAPPKRWGYRGEKIATKYVDGNVRNWKGSWIMYPCGPNRTVLRLQLYLELSIFVPSSIVSKWLRWAATKGVTAVRDIVECGESDVSDA